MFATRRILVVDDEASLRTLMCRIIELEGHRAVMAASGSEALETLAKEKFDLMILDYRLPDMNGRHVMRRLDKVASAMRPFVLLVTGRASYSSNPIKNPLLLGVLKKPFQLTSFRRVLDSTLAQIN
jgi:DNA-binding response OmpR family regulator